MNGVMAATRITRTPSFHNWTGLYWTLSKTRRDPNPSVKIHWKHYTTVKGSWHLPGVWNGVTFSVPWWGMER